MKNSPPYFRRHGDPREPLFLWNARLSFHPTIEVFGRPECSECGKTMCEKTWSAPNKKGKPFALWSCESPACMLNKGILIKPCLNCGMKEGRMMIDARFNRVFSHPRIWGHFAACRLCGSYNDPDERETFVMTPDPILSKLFNA